MDQTAVPDGAREARVDGADQPGGAVGDDEQTFPAELSPTYFVEISQDTSSSVPEARPDQPAQ